LVFNLLEFALMQNNNVVTHPVPATPRSTFKRVGSIVAGSAVLLSAGAANAAIDIAPVVATITDGVTAAIAIGLGFLGFKAGIAVFKSLRSAA
jgi:hypothetical protein